jgi:hypothetical protein
MAKKSFREWFRSRFRKNGNSTSGIGGDMTSYGTKSAVTAIGFATIFTVLLLAAIPATLWGLNKIWVTGPEIRLSVVLIAATATLVIVVAILSVVFSRLKLGDGRAAMGLPEGSIRAIIALLLVALFFISALFLYSSVNDGPQRGPVRTLQGITAQELAVLPAVDIDGVTERTGSGGTVYDVTLVGRLPDNSKADDIASQLVTTVATLVTAIAAFYFGANSVHTARRRELQETTSNTTSQAGPSGGQAEMTAGQAEMTGHEAAMTGGQAEATGREPS